MSQAVTVRQIPDEVHQALKLRAARAGRSLEAEIRQILAETCTPVPSGNHWVDGLLDRAHRRGAGKRQTDSATLIREERDARGR